MISDLALERSLVPPGSYIVGLDEVGRGPLAGPVFACAVALDPHGFDLSLYPGLDDSKRLSERRRKLLAGDLLKYVDFALGAASVAEIDRLNILKASLLAMRRAFIRLQDLNRAPVIRHILVDGPHLPPLPVPSDMPMKALIKGDSKACSIAAASILAKTARDGLMEKLNHRYPAFGFAKNAGYGTKAHRQALEQKGPCPHHRRSFAPVAQCLARCLPDSNTGLGKETL